MDREYVIHIGMTPHPWDNKDNPYYWVIMCDGCNTGFGWSKTPTQAWQDANQYYKKYYKNTA